MSCSSLSAKKIKITQCWPRPGPVPHPGLQFNLWVLRTCINRFSLGLPRLPGPLCAVDTVFERTAGKAEGLGSPPSRLSMGSGEGCLQPAPSCLAWGMFTVCWQCVWTGLGSTLVPWGCPSASFGLYRICWLMFLAGYL